MPGKHGHDGFRGIQPALTQVLQNARQCGGGGGFHKQAFLPGQESLCPADLLVSDGHSCSAAFPAEAQRIFAVLLIPDQTVGYAACDRIGTKIGMHLIFAPVKCLGDRAVALCLYGNQARAA